MAQVERLADGPSFGPAPTPRWSGGSKPATLLVGPRDAVQSHLGSWPCRDATLARQSSRLRSDRRQTERSVAAAGANARPAARPGRCRRRPSGCTARPRPRCSGTSSASRATCWRRRSSGRRTSISTWRTPTSPSGWAAPSARSRCSRAASSGSRPRRRSTSATPRCWCCAAGWTRRRGRCVGA